VVNFGHRAIDLIPELSVINQTQRESYEFSPGQLQTAAEFKLKIFKGGHFFIREFQAKLLETVNAELANL
jgi:surfactin synthase thioesterase subunit